MGNVNCLIGIRRLNLNKCLIDDWTSIECLSGISTLQDLRIISIPLWKRYTSNEHFHLVVGRIPQLKVLNGSIISSEQREESERFFIRFVFIQSAVHHYLCYLGYFGVWFNASSSSTRWYFTLHFIRSLKDYLCTIFTYSRLKLMPNVVTI